MPNDVAVSAHPPGWIKSPLGAVADVAFSNVDKKSRPREPKVRLCNYLDVYQNDYVHDGMPYMEATAAQSQVKKFGLREGDVLITKDSETPDDIGIPTYVNDVGSDVVCGYHLALIRPRGGINPRFLAKQLTTERIRRYFAKEANGTTRYGLSTASVMEIPLWLPTESEQRLIAEILDTLDEAIRKTEQVIAKLQQMKQGLLHDLLTRGIDDNGELRDPACHPDQFKDSPLGRIPREWVVARFGECLDGEPQNGLYKPSSFYSAAGTPIVRIDGFYDGVLAPIRSLKRLRLTSQEVKTYGLEPGNILINRVNSIEFVGKAALVPKLEEPVVFESNMMRCRLRLDRLHPTFAIRWVTGSWARRWFYRRAKSAIAQASVNQSDLTALRLPVPGLDEQERAVELTRGAERRISAETAQLDKLRVLKHGLLDDLLTGRVRVPVAEDAAR